MSDLRARTKHSKIFEVWSKKTTNEYLQKSLDANMRRNQELLISKSLMNNINYVSKCEEKIVDKLNSSRFILRKRHTVSFKNGVKFTNDACIAHENYYDINDKLKLDLQKKVNSQGSGRKALKKIIQFVAI